MSQCAAEDVQIEKLTPVLYRRASFPEEPPAESVPDSKATVIEDLRKQLDTTVFRLLVTAQSREEFKELRGEVFHEYVDVCAAIGTLLRSGTDRDEDSDAEVEEAFVRIKNALETDGWLLDSQTGAKDEALFCLDTLKNAHVLITEIAIEGCTGTLGQDYVKPYQSAIAQEWWSLLHLRCLLFSIRHHVRPSDEVFFSLMEGFRHSVMSYAFAREAVEQKYQSEYDKIDFSAVEPDGESNYLARQADAEHSFFLRRAAEDKAHHRA